MAISRWRRGADGTDGPVESRSYRRFGRSTLRLLEVRLRVPAILVLSALLVGRWDTVRNHWDKLTRGGAAPSFAAQAVSSDTEYFCPMDPGVVSDWPGKCGICNMALVRRKRGEAVALPDGVVARMQLSPYRVQLAGIRTATVGYRPLSRTFDTAGLVRRRGSDLIVPLEISPRSAPWIADGQEAEVRCKELGEALAMRGRLERGPGDTQGTATVGLQPSPPTHPSATRGEGFNGTSSQEKGEGSPPIPSPLVGEGQGGGDSRGKHPRGPGHASTYDAWQATLKITDPDPMLRSGMIALVRFAVPVADLEPFRSLPADPPAVGPNEPRRLYACPVHADTVAVGPGHCPIDHDPLVPRALAENQRVRWWCPMHPEVTGDRAGAACAKCGGMILRPRAVSYRPAGKVLAVPESAIVDTGTRTVLFVESMPGTFDGVQVVLGPRCGDEYPIVRGVEAGQNVAIAGAFLLDAETRLNPSLAAAYFGAAGSTPVPRAEGAGRGADSSPLDQLPEADRAAAKRQKICPVTRKPLGSMGVPPRVVVAGRVVFLCCEGCEGKLKSNPEKYLAALPAESRP